MTWTHLGLQELTDEALRAELSDFERMVCDPDPYRLPPTDRPVARQRLALLVSEYNHRRLQPPWEQA